MFLLLHSVKIVWKNIKIILVNKNNFFDSKKITHVFIKSFAIKKSKSLHENTD